jgi:hypothetical protein
MRHEKNEWWRVTRPLGRKRVLSNIRRKKMTNRFTFKGVSRSETQKTKTSAFLFGMLTAALAFGLVLTGCPTDSDDDDGGQVRTTSERAAFLGNFGAGTFRADFKARFTNQSSTIDGNTEVVVIAGEYPLNGAEADAVGTAYQAGAVIILIEPTGTQQAALTSAIEHRTALAHNTGDVVLCDMYAFNKFDQHHVLNTSMTFSDEIPQQITNVRVDPDTQELVTEEITEGVPSPSRVKPAKDWDAFFGVMIEWVEAHNNGTPNATMSSIGSRAITDNSATDDAVLSAQNAQKFAFSIAGAAGLTLKNTSIACKSTVVTVQYYVWAVYDQNAQEDYYIVREDVTIPSGNLGYVADAPADDGGYTKNTGFYLYEFYSNHVPQNPDGQQLALNTEVYSVSTSPATANGVQTVTTGTTWGMSGSLGFSGLGGTGSLGASLSYSSSTSRTISDFSVTNEYGQVSGLMNDSDTANTRWTYRIANMPAFTGPSFWYPETVDVGEAPSLAKSTANFTNEWIWRIPTTANSGKSYQMRVRSHSYYAYSYNQATAPWQYTDGWQASGLVIDQPFALTPPPRN